MRSSSIHARRRGSIRLFALLCCSAVPALAQLPANVDTVDSRPRPAYDAEGIRIGDMTLLPQLAGELRYFDNLLADDRFRVDDIAYLVSPQLSLESRSERHNAQLGANADLARHADRDTENYDDARLWALASLELGPGEIEGELRLSRLHQARVSPDDLGCADYAGEIVCTGLTEFDTGRAAVAYSYSPGRFMVRSDLAYATLDYDDTQLPLRDRGMSNDDRDRSRAELGLRLGYAMSPEYAAYFETRVDSIDYDQQKDRDGFQRSSEGLELRLGMLLDFTGSTFGEFYFGYLDRDFADPRFASASGPTFGADVSWNVSGLTTLSIEGRRTIENTIVFGASGISESRLALSADHELMSNLVVNAELGIGRDEFENIDREDDLADIKLGGTYLVNRYLRVLFGYRYRTRDTSPDGSNGRVFEGNEVFLRLLGRL